MITVNCRPCTESRSLFVAGRRGARLWGRCVRGVALNSLRDRARGSAGYLWRRLHGQRPATSFPGDDAPDGAGRPPKKVRRGKRFPGRKLNEV